MSTKRQLLEPDVNTDEAHVGDDVRCWPGTADRGSSSPDSIHCSSISFKPKEPTLSSAVIGRALQTDDRLVPTNPKEGTWKAVDGTTICQ